MKFQFVAEHQHEYPVTLMCQVLEISVSGYYAWCKRPISTHQREDARLAAEIQTIFLDNRQVYGSPRIHAALQARGIRCGRKRVVRLMQALGLQAKRHRHHKPTTTRSDPTARFAPNLLNRDFTHSVLTPSGSPTSQLSQPGRDGSTWQ
jgi:putative transposase